MSLIAFATEVATTLSSISPATIVHASLTDEAVKQSAAITVALKALAGVAFFVFALILVVGSHGKIGKIIGAVVVLGLAGWIVFGTGWNWFAQKTAEQLNSAPANSVVLEYSPEVL